MRNTISLNNIFVLKPYQQGQGIKTEVIKGFATPQQHSNVFGLEVLVDTTVNGNTIKAGSIAYIKENLLMTQQWAKDIKKSPAVDGEFILVESQYVTMVTLVDQYKY